MAIFRLPPALVVTINQRHFTEDCERISLRFKEFGDKICRLSRNALLHIDEASLRIGRTWGSP
jgi:hypothetical protein